MMKYLIKKIITLIISLFLISIVTFVAFSVIPGDATISKLGLNASPERIEELREEMGLDDPVLKRYANWLQDACHGDFGESLQYTGNSVKSLLLDRLPYSLTLLLLSLIIIIAVSIPLGILAARKKDSWINGLILVITQITMAIPPFFLGILLTFIFGIALNVFQPGRFISPKENFFASLYPLLFPAIAISLPKITMTAKFLRNSMINELDKDYVRTAYSKGNSANGVLYHHVLKNAMIPVVTFLGWVIADFLAGSIIVEQVFGIPGIGRLLVTAISNRDFPVVQAVIVLVTALVVVVNFVVDVLYRVIDPRVKG
jgi:ABC-type dipeptide/oligopeptide/nickel transport system permease component